MANLKEVMEKRKNYRFFKQDIYPTKDEIEKLLKDVHDLVPQKNNLYQFKVSVWGPEYAKEKESLVLNTVCGEGKSHWRKNGKYRHDFEMLKKYYDEWLNVVKTEGKIKKNLVEFNDQVRAPYLLVYERVKREPTVLQKKQGFPVHVFNFTSEKEYDWYIGASMHGLGTALLANERGIDASFCKCFFWDDHNFSPIISSTREKMENLVFTLSLGYADKNLPYTPMIIKSLYDEHIDWK